MNNYKNMISRRLALKSIAVVCGALSLPLYANDRETVIIPNRCVGCRECTKVCPKDAIRFISGKASIIPEKCISCKLCESICSYGAIKVWTN